MEPEFWHRIWEEKRIGFHSDQVNRSLRRWLPRLDVAAGDTIFVPLCGKSRDMTWLAEQGLAVVGVEINRTAIAEYWSERGIDPSVTSRRGMELTQAGSVSILCGNFFEILPEDLPDFAAFYDRAALIAMPPEMRGDYVAQLDRLSAEARSGLLLTMEHDRGSGPPFSVGAEEVRRRFSGRFTIKRLAGRQKGDVRSSVWYLERPVRPEGRDR